MSDGPQWELSKENSAPLERGRNVNTLEKGLRKETTEENLENERKIQDFERLLSTECDDPLIHWLSYIKFHQEAFPANTHDQFLLMERCTRALIGNNRFANDIRFIRVCVTYADKTQFPGDVFKFLHSHQVGTKTALFWIAWAWVAENKGDYLFAEKVYLKGLAKEASPLKLLQQRHKQFQRRMSRHWLNTSQQQGEIEEETTALSKRATLGGLDDERVRRNDRGARPRETTQRRHTTTDLTSRTVQDRKVQRHYKSEKNVLTNTASGFQIYSEEDAQNGDQSNYDLDQSHIVEHYRELEAEAERNQENIQAAEAWDIRGGYAARYNVAVAKVPQALSFAIHVDDECIAQETNVIAEEHVKLERMRRDRDRAFREREGEDMAEKLTKDPMRYIRDPSRLGADISKEEPDSKPKASISCGFNKKLLAKDASGQEQCFEERRMVARCYRLMTEAGNFNILAKGDSRIDEDSTDDVDMEVEEINDDEQEGLFLSRERISRRVLFSTNVSMDSHCNSFVLNASTASSTVNERNAVGLTGAKEEETINTKLAMKELSMMFSSPAMGLADDDSPTAQRPHMSDDDSDTATYSLIHELVDARSQCDVNNSLIHEGIDENANRAENPHARTNASRSFGTTVLRPMDCDEDDRLLAILPPPSSAPRFQIFADESFDEGPQTIDGDIIHVDDKVSSQNGFHSTTDENAKGAEKKHESGYSMFVADDALDKAPAPSAGGFSIFLDDDEFSETKPSPKHPVVNTTPFTLYRDNGRKDSDSEQDDGTVGAGDTATFSIFGEAMDALNDAGKSKRRNSSLLSTTHLPTMTAYSQDLSDNEFNVDDFKRYKSGNTEAVLTGYSPAFGDISQIIPDEISRMLQQSPTLMVEIKPDGAVEYNALHKDDIRTSLRNLDQEARKKNTRRPFSQDSDELDLGKLLSTKGTVRDMPTQSMPRALRKKTSTQGLEVHVGSKSGVIKHELGRGSYGVVVMMETENMDAGMEGNSIVAVKAQAPTDCLAWEYEVMRRLEERVLHNCPSTTSSPFPFPVPFSFVALADGGLLGMTAGSATGMNLVDIVNVYKIVEGGTVPELIAIHYTARMLKHLETLHWHGKILHCDAKPDNWVLMASENAFEGCGSMLAASDLMLVDFGRSVDLAMCAKDGADPMNVKLFGEATTEDLACVAMRKGCGWSFDVDTFGVCASSHVLLFGVHLEIEQGSNHRWKPRKALRRYWQKDLWSNLFDTLLNLDEGSQTAIGSRPGSLRCLRQTLESYLNGKTKELVSLLKHQARILPDSRPVG